MRRDPPVGGAVFLACHGMGTMAKAAAKEKSTNEFSDYRDKLVVERKTIWPKELNVGEADRPALAAKLHAQPQQAAVLTYIRCPTGFVQQITVTKEDLDRLGKK